MGFRAFRAQYTVCGIAGKGRLLDDREPMVQAVGALSAHSSGSRRVLESSVAQLTEGITEVPKGGSP